MAQYRAIGAVAQELDELVHDFKEDLVLFYFTSSPSICCYLPVGLVWNIHVLAPASTFKAEYRMSTIKLVPYFLDAGKDGM